MLSNNLKSNLSPLHLLSSPYFWDSFVFFFGGFLSFFLLFVVKEVAVKGEFVLLIFQREWERQRETERDHGWTSSSRSTTTTTSLYVIIHFRYCTNLTGRLELCQKDSSFFFFFFPILEVSTYSYCCCWYL